jgi:hypothetical protein
MRCRGGRTIASQDTQLTGRSFLLLVAAQQIGYGPDEARVGAGRRVGCGGVGGGAAFGQVGPRVRGGGPLL